MIAAWSDASVCTRLVLVSASGRLGRGFHLLSSFSVSLCHVEHNQSSSDSTVGGETGPTHKDTCFSAFRVRRDEFTEIVCKRVIAD